MKFYDVLGVQSTASDAEIRNAYRRLAMKWHPDRHSSPADKAVGEAKFKSILEAYSTLSDENARKIYDLQHHRYEDYFGSQPTQSRDFEWARAEAERERAYRESIYPRGLDVKWKAVVPLHVAVAGGEAVYTRQVRVVCPTCEGDRWHDETCAACRGTGVNGAGTSNRRYCGQCGGHGSLEIDCGECEGKGKISETVTTRIRVPAGVVDGSEIVARNLGKPSKYFCGLPGDLHITIAIKPEKGFKFSGADIVGSAKVPFSTAMLGGAFMLDLPTGRSVEILIQARSNSGKKIRLVGLGLSFKGEPAGDVVLTVSIVLPKSKRRLTQTEEIIIRSLDS